MFYLRFFLFFSFLPFFTINTTLGMNSLNQDEASSSQQAPTVIYRDESDQSSSSSTQTKKKRKKKKRKKSASGVPKASEVDPLLQELSSVYIDNEDEVVDEFFGVLVQPGEFGFKLCGIPLDEVIAENSPFQLNYLDKLQAYIDQQLECAKPNGRILENRHRNLRLWRLRNFYRLPARVDSDLDGFERAALETLVGTIKYTSSLLDSSAYTPSLNHILLAQDALLIQIYHLLFFRFERLRSSFRFDECLSNPREEGLKKFSFSLNDIVPTMVESFSRRGGSKNRSEENDEILRKLISRPWIYRLNMVASRVLSPELQYLGALVDESYLSRSSLSSSAPWYQQVLCEALDEAPVCALPTDELRVQIDEDLSRLRIRLEEGIVYSNVARFITDILEPLEDLSDLEMSDDVLTIQHPQFMGVRRAFEYGDALRTTTDPRRFILLFAVSRLNDLGTAISEYFPGTYFQKDSSLQPLSLQETLYRFIPFKVLRNIALNCHHGRMFKREKSILLVREHMREIVSFCRVILPYVKEYVVCLTAQGLNQSYMGPLKEKPFEEIKVELESAVSNNPTAIYLSEYAINLSYLFFSHMNVLYILDELTKNSLPLSQWTFVMQRAFCRVLVILGETSKGITESVRMACDSPEVWKTLERFRDEFSHFEGTEYKLPRRLSSLFKEDANGPLVFEGLDEMRNIYLFFSSYCRHLWEESPAPQPLHIAWKLEALFKILITLELEPSPHGRALTNLNRPENVRIPPDYTILRQTYEKRAGQVTRVLTKLKEVVDSSEEFTLQEFDQTLTPYFPLCEDMNNEHQVMKIARQLIGTRTGIRGTQKLLLAMKDQLKSNPAGVELQVLVERFHSIPLEMQENFKTDANLMKLLLKYSNGLQKESELKEKLRKALDEFNIDAEFENFLKIFFSLTSTKVKEKFDHEVKVRGMEQAEKYLQSLVRRFGINDWNSWVKAFKGNYCYLNAPERELYGHLDRAYKTAHKLMAVLNELKPIAKELKDTKSDDLRWECIEFSLPQIRDLIDEIHLSIQKIRALQPNVLRNIEVQMLNLRLMGNRLAHLNDVIEFQQYNTLTRRSSLNVHLRDIFGTTSGTSSTLPFTFLDALENFGGCLETLLTQPQEIFQNQLSILPAKNSNGKWVYQTSPTETGIFHERDISRDGDCGFRCLGLTREHAVNLLLQNTDSQAVRDAVADDIRAAYLNGRLVGTNFPEKFRRQFYKIQLKIDNLRRSISGVPLAPNLTSESIIPLIEQETLVGHKECVEMLSSLKMYLWALETVNQEIDKFTHSKEAYTDFIKSEFREGAGWLSYIRNGKGTLYALAKILGMNVQIWEPNPLKAGYLRRIPLADGLEGQKVNILHTDRLSHFNILEEAPSY